MKTKAQPICAFVFASTKSLFSHDAANHAINRLCCDEVYLYVEHYRKYNRHTCILNLDLVNKILR